MTGVLQVLLSSSKAPLSVTASPTSLYGERPTIGSCESTATTATASGGTGPYSYDWEYVSGDTVIAPNSDTSATTSFSAIVGPTNSFRQSVWRCKVTDAASAVSYSNNVTIDLVYLP